MGMVTIEVPQQLERHFLITDAKVATAVLQQLEHLANFRPNLSTVTDDEVLSVWSDHTGTAEEIARQLRQQNQQHD
jgi:hypothetical protein